MAEAAKPIDQQRVATDYRLADTSRLQKAKPLTRQRQGLLENGMKSTAMKLGSCKEGD